LAKTRATRLWSIQHAEIKSMRIARQYLRKGVADRILEHIILQAKSRKLQHLNFETGSQTFLNPP
jgi:putative acetyltransferase